MSALAHLLTEISDISVKYLVNYLPKVKLFGVCVALELPCTYSTYVF